MAVAVLTALLWLQHFLFTVTAAETLYLDTWRDCRRRDRAFDLDRDTFTLKSSGGQDLFQALYCEMSFSVGSDYGICLTFQEFDVDYCGVKLLIFNSDTDSGVAWQALTCYDSKPTQMCTTSHHITIKVVKDGVTFDNGYTFEIDVERSVTTPSPQDKHAHEKRLPFTIFGVSLTMIFGASVVIATILVSCIVYCCCCRRRGEQRSYKKTEEKKIGPILAERDQQEGLVQASAPPVDYTHLWSGDQRDNHYFHKYASHELPPPYLSPPYYKLPSPPAYDGEFPERWNGTMMRDDNTFAKR